eukprot:3938796-Rhodomonas_salina.3
MSVPGIAYHTHTQIAYMLRQDPALHSTQTAVTLPGRFCRHRVTAKTSVSPPLSQHRTMSVPVIA